MLTPFLLRFKNDLQNKSNRNVHEEEYLRELIFIEENFHTDKQLNAEFIKSFAPSPGNCPTCGKRLG